MEIIREIRTNINSAMEISSQFHILYVDKGTVQVTLEGKSYEISASQCVVILPHQNFSFFSFDSSSSLHIVYPYKFTMNFYEKTLNTEAVMPVFNLTDNTNLIPLLKSSTDEYLLCSIIYNIIWQFSNKTSFNIKNQKSHFFMTLFLSYIEKNYKEEITLQKIAEDFSYDYHYISQLFNRIFKANFSHIINEYRITKSLPELLQRKKTVTQIAFDYGFNSLRSYNRNFLKFMDMSPMGYIKSKL